MHPLEWFTVGKRIWRDEVSCGCDTCIRSTETGLVISSKKHAEYLFMIQSDLDIIYRDEK